MTPLPQRAYRPWLPANTVAPQLAYGALADMADGWSRAWFPQQPMRAVGALARIDARGELRNTQWHAHDGGLAIGLSASGLVSLGAHVLDVPIAERPAAEVALLEAVGTECFDDLKRRAAAVLSLPEKGWTAGTRTQAWPVHRLEVAGAGRNPVLTLEVSADLFVAFVKAKLPPPPSSKPLGKPAKALGALQVAISAMLGRSVVTVAELSSLAEGDVLVLDRPLDAPLPLLLGGMPAARGACTISDDGTALKITEALIG